MKLERNGEVPGKPLGFVLPSIGALSQERLSELLTKLLSLEEEGEEENLSQLLTAEESRLFSEFVKKEDNLKG